MGKRKKIKLNMKFNQGKVECAISPGELKLVKDMMLGKQLRQKYLTLCTKCHHEIDTGR